MTNNKFEIGIVDVGDSSVGLQSELTFRAELSDGMVEHLKDSNLLKEFKDKLESLVREYYDPETSYNVYDTDELEAEREYYERLEREGLNA